MALQVPSGAPQRPTIDYTLFRIETLVDNSTTDFDLFINLHQHFILYSGNGYRWERSELTELLRVGHETLFIRAVDLPKAKMYETLVGLPQIEKEQAPRERIQTIEQVGAKFVQCLYEGDLTEGCVRKAETIAGAMAECIKEDPSCIQLLSGLGDHDYYTYFHSVRVAAYAVAIAISMGMNDPDHLRSIALGSLFHDIGKRDVPLAVLNKKGPLSESEWQLMRSHPEKGFVSVAETILGHVPREIVLHHHEKLNGSGYPHGLARGSLLVEVQIATLADIFDALTSARAYQTKRTRYEGLDFIKHKLLGEEIASDVFKALVVCLAA